MNNIIKSILFDLDGTLLDTAPDMADTLNQLRYRYHLPPLAFNAIRPYVGHGSKALLKLGFEIEETHDSYLTLQNEFLELYEKYLLNSPQLFPEIENVLLYLNKKKLPWGVVTNRPTQFTHQLLKNFGLDKKAACIVCGDTLPTRKPHPGTLLHACEQLQLSPASCLYVGDAETDVIASKAAGMRSLVALYGYIHEEEDPLMWQADGLINMPSEIIGWLY
jgi:2-phosphoglycolate phosphatase